jgi:hypothetical protein
MTAVIDIARAAGMTDVRQTNPLRFAAEACAAAGAAPVQAIAAKIPKPNRFITSPQQPGTKKVVALSGFLDVFWTIGYAIGA